MKRYMESHGILSEHELMFYGPEGAMSLEEALARGYDVRRYVQQGMMVSNAQLAAQMANQNAAQQRMAQYRQLVREPLVRDEAAFALGMNACDHRCSHPPEPQVGDVQPGETRYMGTPCALPREGLKVRTRRYMERGKRWASRS